MLKLIASVGGPICARQERFGGLRDRRGAGFDGLPIAKREPGLLRAQRPAAFVHCPEGRDVISPRWPAPFSFGCER